MLCTGLARHDIQMLCAYSSISIIHFLPLSMFKGRFICRVGKPQVFAGRFHSYATGHLSEPMCMHGRSGCSVANCANTNSKIGIFCHARLPDLNVLHTGIT